jgi:hypothetical protein
MSFQMTPAQEADFWDDRRPALYASLITLLIINNVVVIGRCFAHWRAHYRKSSWKDMHIFPEDIFIVISVVSCVPKLTFFFPSLPILISF